MRKNYAIFIIGFLIVFWGLVGYGVYFLVQEAEVKGEVVGVKEGRDLASIEDRALIKRAPEDRATVKFCDVNGCDEVQIACLERYNP